MSLQGKSVIITGGHLGTASARLLAQEGASIAYIYHSKRDEAEKLVKSFGGNGKHITVQGDLTTEKAVKDVFASAKIALGKLHIAINNVGKVIKKPIVDTTEEEFDVMFALNAKAAYFFNKHAAINIEDGGKIVSTVTTLLAAYTGYYSVYAGSKAPVEHFTRAASKELMSRRISTNCVAPGPMDTPFFYPAENDGSVAYHKSQAMEGRLTHVEDIAPVIKCLVSDGQWISGQTIFANGGYTTR